MYSKQKLNAIAEQLRQLINNHMPQFTTTDVNAVTTQMLGTAIAYSLPLPSESIEGYGSVEEYYNRFHRHKIHRFVDELNEEFIFDISTVQRVAVQMWLFRYRMLFDPRSVAGLVYTLACSEGIYPEYITDSLAKVYRDNGATTRALNDVSNSISVAVSQTLLNPEDV